MYIAPNSTIHVLKNVPLDNTYRDNIIFDSVDSQRAYFVSKNKYTVSQYTYQRKEKKLRIGVLADTLYDCNYIMFQNTAFGQKWFYAFIVDVEYVNNEASEITFEIDVMQTWMFDYTLNKSFIERQHSVTDEIGDNLVRDNLEHGEYIMSNVRKTGHFVQTTYIVAATFDKNLADAVGDEYMGVYSGLCYNEFTNVSELNQFLEDATADNKSDGIIAIFTMPSDFITSNNSAKYWPFSVTPNTTDIDGYTPKNKKMFTHPYNYLYMTNNLNSHAEYMIEFFEKSPTGSVLFGVEGGLNSNPEFFCYPSAYKGVAKNYVEKIVLSGTPVCAWSTDAFKAWWAQNGGQFAGGLVGGVAAGAGALLGATPVGLAAIIGGIGYATIKAGEILNHLTQPPNAKGSTTANLQWASGSYDFFVYDCFITKEFAEKIDNFWCMYGYPVNGFGVPNRKARPHWTFVKCADVCITGSVPVDDMAKIKSVYNNGTTFWVNGWEVGDYSLNNNIV